MSKHDGIPTIDSTGGIRMGPREGGGEPQKEWGVIRRSHDRLGDPLEVTIPDPDHSEGEFRASGDPRRIGSSLCPTPNAIRESESLAYGLRLLRKDENMSQDVAG